MRKPVLAILSALFVALASFGTAAGQEAPKSTGFNVPFRGVNTPGTTLDLAESVIDYGPGSSSRATAAKWTNYLTVLEGELTIQVGGDSTVVAAGKGIAVPVGATVTTSNSGSAQARLFVSTLLPVAAVEDLHQPNSKGVRIFSSARRTMSGAPGIVDVIQVLTVYDPGFRTPNHVMNEFHLFIMLTGVTDFGFLSGGVERYAAPRQGVMDEGMAGWMANTTQERASFVLTWVGTPGKPLTSPVAAPGPGATVVPAPPNTGNGLVPGHEGRQAEPGLVLGATGVALFTLSVLAMEAYRRTQRQPRTFRPDA